MAVDCFLELGDMEGESADGTYEKKIDVLAWSFGMSQQGTAHGGGGTGAGKAQINDLSITKYIDKASPNLMQACCRGDGFDTAALICRKAGGPEPVLYLKVEMEQVMVTSVNTGGSGGEDRFTENVSLNFARYKVTYTPQKGDQAAEAAVGPVGWDIAKNQAI